MLIALLIAASGIPGNDGFMFDQRFVPLMKRSQAELATATKVTNDLKRNIKDMRELLKKLRTAQDHPAVKQAYLDVDAYEKKVLALATIDAPPPATDPNAPPLTGTPAFKLTRVRDEHTSASAALDRATAEDFSDGGTKEKYFMDRSRTMREMLKEIPQQSHPSVQAVLGDIDAYEKRVASKAADGKTIKEAREAKAAAVANEVASELDELAAYFNQGTFTAALDPPFTEERVRAWIEQLKQWDAAKAKGAATLDELVEEHPEHRSNPKLKSLRWWFTDPQGLSGRLEGGINSTAGSSPSGNGAMRGRVELVERSMKPGGFADSRFNDDVQLAVDLRQIQEGVEAARALVIFAKEYEGSAGAAEQKQASDVTAFQAKIEARGKSLIAKTRMPAPQGQTPELLAIAKKLLPDCGAGPAERIVINYGVHNKTERKSSSRDEGRYIRITSWNEAWQEFQAAAAEKVGSDYRIVYYDIKHRSVGPQWTVTGRWFCSGRIESGRILKENIAK